MAEVQPVFFSLLFIKLARMTNIKVFMLAVLAVAGLSVQAQVRDDASTTVQEDTLFYESFDNMAGKGGNDGNWSISYSIDVRQFGTDGAINEGWKHGITDVRPAYKCVVIGTTGNLVSPALAKLKGAAVLTFRAGATVKSKTAAKTAARLQDIFRPMGFAKRHTSTMWRWTAPFAGKVLDVRLSRPLNSGRRRPAAPR